MIAVKPTVKIDGDSTGVQYRHGWLVGFTRHLGVWRFGFRPGGEDAKTFGVSSPQFTYVLAVLKNGETVATYQTDSTDPKKLPVKFQKVLKAKFLFLKEE